jgi:outer membrane protein W
MRYINGRWWRYDGRYGRWVWLYDNDWYYQDGVSVYSYQGNSGQYEYAGESFQTFTPPKLAVTVNLGRFGLNSGGPGAVVNENQSYLNFDGAVGGVSAAVEVNRGLNNYLEAGLGVGYVKATANSTYRDYVRDDGAEIRQQTLFKNVPLNVNLKLMPWGRDKKFQPYVGAGVQVNKWNYSESGQFIDFDSPNYDIYKETYKADGVAVGPVAIAGLRIPLNKTVSLNGEYRRQWAKGELPAAEGFAGDHIDLGGATYQLGVTINLK